MLHLCSILVAALHWPIIVRRSHESFLIRIHVPGKPVKTLQRPATEVLARSLGRISRAYASSPAKSQRRANGECTEPKPERCILLDACGMELDSSMSALQAWSGAARLQLGMASIDVLFEPAEVASLALPPVVPFVGTPLTPSIETLGCDAHDCFWVWERLAPGGPADAWQRVGSGCEYQPTSSDDGARLRVRAVPPAAGCAAAYALPLLSGTAEADEPVEVSPHRPLLQRRVRAMGERRGRHAFRLLSYNVLADCYSRHWDSEGSIHSYCAPRLTRPAHRMPQLLTEVLAFAPDVVILQEVDRSWFAQYWEPAMRMRGYASSYLSKRGGSSSEGLAAFVRSAAFEVVEVREAALSIDRSDQQSTAPAPAWVAEVGPLLDSQPGTREGLRTLPTVAQLLLLREVVPSQPPPPPHAAPHVSPYGSLPTAHASPYATAHHAGRHVLVANTHLYFSNPAMHVRLLQTATLLGKMHAWAAHLHMQHGAAGAPGA